VGILKTCQNESFSMLRVHVNTCGVGSRRLVGCMSATAFVLSDVGTIGGEPLFTNAFTLAQLIDLLAPLDIPLAPAGFDYVKLARRGRDPMLSQCLLIN